MFTKYFHVPTFIISLAIGIFIVYIQAPELTTIFVYPNPDNKDKILYNNHGNSLYNKFLYMVSGP